ncbi:MAG TPA: CPBP family intramembrane glutamic endopeptidase, partial [Xanthomonadales bacterium]|nr:CPBP family intramembrane glutamic endopeptidase [Xanthomonadales bacterium]
HLGYAPSLAAGQPYGEIFGIFAYTAMAWYAWRQLRKARSPMPLRVPSRTELLIFAGTLIVMLITNFISDAILSAIGQADHVQVGFENFSVKMNTATGTAFAIALTALGGIAFGPFAEELALRGLLFGGLTSRFGVLPAAILSGIVFGALHGDPIYFTVLAVHGCIVALAYAATGNLLIPIALHASTNAITLWFAITPTLAPK